MEQIVLTSLQISDIEQLIARVIRRELEHIQLDLQPDREELLGRREAAAMLGITLPTLRLYTKRGLIPAYRMGARVRYKRGEVIASLKKVDTNARLQRRRAGLIARPKAT